MDNTCPCNEARLLAEKANDVAQRALYDLHHTTVKGLQGELAQLRTELAAARGHNGSNINNGTHPVHPEYGPCDGFAPGGMCSVCLDVIQGLRADLPTHERETALREYEQLLQSHTAQTKAMEADLRDALTENAALRDTTTQYKALYEGEREARLEQEEQIETLRATWNNLHSAYSWTTDRLMTTQSERDAARASSFRLLRAVTVLCRRGNKVVGEAGLLYKALQTIRRDTHFANRTVDTDPDKWQDLCLSIMRQIDAALPRAKFAEKEAARLWEEMRAEYNNGVVR